MVRWAAVNDQVETALGPASAASLRALADQRRRFRNFPARLKQIA